MKLALIRDDKRDGSPGFGEDWDYELEVDDDLAALLGCAGSWSGYGASSALPLNFDATFAALVGSTAVESEWFRNHLARRGVSRTLIDERSGLRETSIVKAKTTMSFRQAIETARALAVEISPQAPIAVRHLMAAFPIRVDWHIADFLRLRVDRRAWCLDLGTFLAEKYPGEAAGWTKYRTHATPVQNLGFVSDTPYGTDLLSLDREIETLSRLAVARAAKTPMSIGVFGAWGSGKSFFMRSMRDRVSELATAARATPGTLEHHAEVVQIEFNAWHYSEGNLAAAFVEHIFRNLRRAPDEDDREVAKRTAAVLAKLGDATAVVKQREGEVAAATAAHAAAAKAVVDIDQQIATAVAEKEAEIAHAETRVSNASTALKGQLDTLELEIQKRQLEAPIRAVAAELLSKLDLQPFMDARTSAEKVVDQATKLGTKGKVLAYGGVAAAIGFVATVIAGSDAWLQITGVATAVGAALTAAMPWFAKLDKIAVSGEKLVEAEERVRQDIAKAVRESHATTLADAERRVAETKADREQLDRELALLRSKPTQIRATLAELETKRSEAVARHVEATAKLTEAKTALSRVGHGQVLDEFLSERIADDTYRKELTLFSRVRTDFERLSKLMTKADDKFLTTKRPEDAAVVGRVVLYIDDLDRCSPQRVIDVLQLVHLLLAFPLFVCVVAVDPRVVNSALAEIPSLKKVADDASLGTAPGPRDYVEKIFQIPVWLRPVDKDKVSAVASAYFTVPLNASEQAHLQQLSNLLDGVPRRLKRFANTYRLLMSSLTDSELEVFYSSVRTLGSPEGEGHYVPHKLCMSLLVTLWHPGKSEQLAASISSSKTIREAVQMLRGEVGTAIALAFDDRGLDSPVRTLELWFERVRRYSFFL